MDRLLHAVKLASALTGAFALGMIATARAEEVYCRVTGAQGATCGRVAGEVTRLLDAAPWNGGRETGVMTPLAGAKLLASSEPRNIRCLADSHVGKEKNPPKFIRWFAKAVSAAATDGAPVEIPPEVEQLKSEVEVVIVVERRLKQAYEAEARDAIFAYAPGNEIFAFPEAFQKVNGEDPTRTEVMLAAELKLGGKFTPCGPFIGRDATWANRLRLLTVTNPAMGKKQTHRGDCSGFLCALEGVLSELPNVLTVEPGDIVFAGMERGLVLDLGDDVIAAGGGSSRLTPTTSCVPPPNNLSFVASRIPRRRLS